MKYSWQKMQAPFRRPSMVEALMMSSISGTALGGTDSVSTASREVASASSEPLKRELNTAYLP